MENEQIQINDIVEFTNLLSKDPLERTVQEIHMLQQTLSSISFFKKLSHKIENELVYNIIKECTLVHHGQSGKFIYTNHSRSSSCYILLSGKVFILADKDDINATMDQNNRSTMDQNNKQTDRLSHLIELTQKVLQQSNILNNKDRNTVTHICNKLQNRNEGQNDKMTNEMKKKLAMHKMLSRKRTMEVKQNVAQSIQDMKSEHDVYGKDGSLLYLLKEEIKQGEMFGDDDQYMEDRNTLALVGEPSYLLKIDLQFYNVSIYWDVRKCWASTISRNSVRKSSMYGRYYL